MSWDGVICFCVPFEKTRSFLLWYHFERKSFFLNVFMHTHLTVFTLLKNCFLFFYRSRFFKERKLLSKTKDRCRFNYWMGQPRLNIYAINVLIAVPIFLPAPFDAPSLMDWFSIVQFIWSSGPISMVSNVKKKHELHFVISQSTSPQVNFNDRYILLLEILIINKYWETISKKS